MNVGISVSRVGGAAQIKAMKKVAGADCVWTWRRSASWKRSPSWARTWTPGQRSFGSIAATGWLKSSSSRRTARCRSRSRSSRSSSAPGATSIPCPLRTCSKFEREFLEHVKGSPRGDPQRDPGEQEALRGARRQARRGRSTISRRASTTTDGSSVVPDEHVDAMDEEDVEKESVKVRKPQPKKK